MYIRPEHTLTCGLNPIDGFVSLTMSWWLKHPSKKNIRDIDYNKTNRKIPNISETCR